MKIKQISKKIQSKDGDDLTNYCFENVDDLGLFLLNELLDRYRYKTELNVAILISELLNTVLSHWEGKDLFELNFYIEVLNTHNQSEIILECILSFCFPPYLKEFRLMVDMDYYILQLKKINPSHRFLKVL